MFQKTFRFLLIFFIITGWVFSSWPQVYNFPPRIQKTYAAPPVMAAGVTGTQVSSIDKGTTGTFVGGAFTFVMDKATGSITSIGVTVNDATGLSNMDLYTDTVASCNTADPVATATLFGSNATVATKTTITGSLTVGIVASCVYVVVDVGSGAGSTLEISINAITDITDNPNSGTFPLAVDGTTTLNTPANATPTLTVTQPDGTDDTVVVGDSYDITYDLADTDDVVTAAFYYDTDNTGLNGTAITGACETAAEGTGVTCAWDTTGVATGSYYVYGITNDGSGEVSDYSPGQITITAVAVSITLDQSSFDYGIVPKDTASSTLNLWAGAGITATNNGNVTANFTIYGANTTGGGTNWILDTANSTQDHYIHKFCNDTDNDCTSPPTNYTALTTSPATLKNSIPVDGIVSFQLQISTPQAVTDYNTQNAVVTVQASQ